VHPQDVAQHLSASVQVLRDAVAGQQGSPIDDITLDGVHLRTRFVVETLQSQAVPRGLAVAVAPGMLQQATMNIPILGTRQRETRVLMMDCEDWDSQPPTATLELADGSPLPRDRWPRDPEGQGIVADHPLFGDRPFFCRPGTREFHSHPQHEDHPWDRYREGTTLSAIVLGLIVDLTTRWTMR